MAVNPVSSPSTGPDPGSRPVSKGPSKPRRTPQESEPHQPRSTDVTRAGMIWVAVSAGLVVLVLLITFILQNQDRVTVQYFAVAGELSLGMALFIAAVAGGILVAIAGAARILQLRSQRRHPPDSPRTAAGGHEPTTGP